MVIEVKLLVGGRYSDGVPTLEPVIVTCLGKQHVNGDCYDAAKDALVLDGPLFVIDEYDGAPKGVFDCYDWDDAALIDITGEQADANL